MHIGNDNKYFCFIHEGQSVLQSINPKTLTSKRKQTQEEETTNTNSKYQERATSSSTKVEYDNFKNKAVLHVGEMLIFGASTIAGILTHACRKQRFSLKALPKNLKNTHVKTDVTKIWGKTVM